LWVTPDPAPKMKASPPCVFIILTCVKFKR
jgi:hypothetical protein